MMTEVKRALAAFLIALRGKSDLHLVAVRHHPNQKYDIHTTNGATITIECIEYEYRYCFSSFFIPDKTHYIYRVYGKCSGDVPEAFKRDIERGFHIGRLLPHSASLEEQKRAAISAFVSMTKNLLKGQ
jgi:hypothetical protein